MENDDDDDWRQRSEKRRQTTAVIVAAAGTLITAIEPFLQLLFHQAAEEEPKPKVVPMRERRVFDSRGGAYNNTRTNLLDEKNALVYSSR